MLSKKLSTSRKFATVGQSAGEFPQLLYALLLPHCDDFGRQPGDAFTVKHQVFPTSPRPEAEFDAALIALEEAELISRYTVAGQQILQVQNFDQHQQGLHKRTSSEFPESPGDSNAPPLLPSELNLTEQNLELKGTQENVTALRARFERFWQAYPKKVGKDAAWLIWQRRKPGDDLTDQMIAAVQEQATSAQWLKDGGEFIPHPRTWLNQGRWQDVVSEGPQLKNQTVKNATAVNRWASR